MEHLIPLKITNYFFENPYDEFYLRELARKLKLSPYAAKKYLDLLVKEGIVKDEKKANLRYFKANMGNLFFRHLKVAFSINLILKSGLVDFLKESLANVSSITLFGSVAKGEDDKKSDIDILVIGTHKHINLNNFEGKIGKEINLHILSWSEWSKKAKSNDPFYFEVISYGISLYGELPIVKCK